MSPRHYQHGFHSTATCGVFASAAAAARLYGLDVAQTRRTLAIAASQAGGLRENFGTMTKPFHAGRAAEAGIIAADLAAAGWTAADGILESPRGFFQAHGGGFAWTRCRAGWAIRGPSRIRAFPSSPTRQGR